MTGAKQTRVYSIYMANEFLDTKGNPIARFTDEEPSDWDVDMGEFHKNESSWCSGNVFDRPDQVEVLDRERWEGYVKKYARGECPCFEWCFRVYIQN